MRLASEGEASDASGPGGRTQPQCCHSEMHLKVDPAKTHTAERLQTGRPMTHWVCDFEERRLIWIIESSEAAPAPQYQHARCTGTQRKSSTSKRQSLDILGVRQQQSDTDEKSLAVAWPVRGASNCS